MEFISKILEGNAGRFPDRTAVICGDRTMSYEQLNREVNRLANAFLRIGLKKGDRIAILMRGGMEWLLTFYACQKLAVGLVLIHLRLLPDEMLRMANLAGVSMLVYSSEYSTQADYITSKIDNTVLLVRQGNEDPLPNGALSFEDLMLCQNTHDLQVEIEGKEDSIILFTSGTTSAPKGIVRTQRMMESYASILADEASLYRGDVMITPAPLYHATGICCVIKMLVNAGTLLLLDRFDIEMVCSQIEKHHATQIALVPPTSYQQLKESGHTEKYDLSSITLAHITAGKASPECLEALFKTFPNAGVRLSWGSTEASNITELTLRREEIDDRRDLLLSVGTPNPVSELKLVDMDGNTVEGSGKGEAFVHSPLVFSGYLNAPEITAGCFSDGWFNTEDIMYRDENGYYYLLDRKRDMIKTGGENVYALEVEQELLKHPKISECAVIGVPDKRYGEAIAVAIVLKKGTVLNGREFISFCRKNMSSFKKPKYWALVEELPKNEVGKIQKSKLRSQNYLFESVI